MLPLAVSLAYFSIEFLISYFLPAFRPGIEPVRISLLTVLFWQAGGIYGQIVYATKRIVPLIAIAAASLAAVAAALYWQARAGTPTLAGVAWTIVAGHSLYFVLVLTASYWLVYGRLRDGVRERLPVLAAPLVAVALMRMITTLTGPLNGASWIADLAKGAGHSPGNFVAVRSACARSPARETARLRARSCRARTGRRFAPRAAGRHRRRARARSRTACPSRSTAD